MGELGRCISMLFVMGALACAADTTVVPGRTREGNLDARAHLQAVHAAMQRECGATPGSARCQRLKREFQQEARNYQKQHRRECR
jgi:hypothetical protein